MSKDQKPTDYDISFKYICTDCGNEHWLFLREVQTKDFKIVCDCSQIIEPALVKDIEILYNSEKEIVTEEFDTPNKMLDSCCKTLSKFGYSETESQEMINQSFQILQSEEPSVIIEYAIKNFGE